MKRKCKGAVPVELHFVVVLRTANCLDSLRWQGLQVLPTQGIKAIRAAKRVAKGELKSSLLRTTPYWD